MGDSPELGLWVFALCMQGLKEEGNDEKGEYHQLAHDGKGMCVNERTASQRKCSSWSALPYEVSPKHYWRVLTHRLQWLLYRYKGRGQSHTDTVSI